MNNRPLSGIKVLDLTRLLPGPLCSLYLADLGAEVVKVEEPLIGDYARKIPPIKRDNSIHFLMLNRNKKSITLNLKETLDQKRFLKLCESFDVVLESFRPGVTEKLGIDYKSVAMVNSKIVYCSLTGFGQSGPLKDRAGHDINYLALNGILDQMGSERPTPGNIQFADVAGGSMNATVGILAALLDAERSGTGRYIDVAMMDGAMALCPLILCALQAQGHAPQRGADFLSGGRAWYGVYATADGRFMALGAVEEKFWNNFCDTVNKTEWKTRFNESGNKLKTDLEDLFLERSQIEWTKLFNGVDACCTPVLTLDEAMNHPQVLARSMIIEANCAQEGLIKQFALPIRMSDFQFCVYSPAPRLGENTEEIFHRYGIK